MKFRKKPVVVEAYQLHDHDDQKTRSTPYWLIEAVIAKKIEIIAADGKTKIHTLEGVMTADIGDWIIQGVKGELYPCKPDIFAATYEPAE